MNMIAKEESRYKSDLMKVIKEHLPNFVAIRHEDVRTGGIPDLSLTGWAKTTWWEFKHGTPKFATDGLQELTCKRLAGAGYCRYVIWEENKNIKRTLIIHPKDILTMEPEASCIGFDYRWLVDFMSKVHRP